MTSRPETDVGLLIEAPLREDGLLKRPSPDETRPNSDVAPPNTQKAGVRSTVEAALPSVDVVLPAASDVVRVDQSFVDDRRIGLGVELGNPIAENTWRTTR